MHHPTALPDKDGSEHSVCFCAWLPTWAVEALEERALSVRDLVYRIQLEVARVCACVGGGTAHAHLCRHA